MKATHLTILSNKYQVLSKRIRNLMETGRFQEMSIRRWNSLLKRWHRYHLRLSKWLPQSMVAIGLGLYMMLTSSTCHHFTLSPEYEPFGITAVGNINKPVFADIDGDGDNDAFVGTLEGDIFFFENAPSSNGQVFAAPTSNPFGLSDVGYNNAPAFADIDGDGDLDAFVGERDGNINFFRNNGTSTNPAFVLDTNSEPLNIYASGNYRTPTLADIDGDGDLDLFVGDEDGTTIFFLNVGTTPSLPYFSERPSYLGFSDIGSQSAPSFVDIDGDGDLDAFVGEHSGNINFFANNGSSDSASFVLSTDIDPFGLSDVGTFSAPSFTDIDGDGDLDVFIGGGAANISFFAGTAGDPSFELSSQTAPFGLSDVDDLNKPAFVDIDGDGDLDAFVGDKTGEIIFFENNGSSLSPNFVLTANSTSFGLSGLGTRVAPTFVDIDGDGNFDAFVGEHSGNMNFFRNTGGPTSASFEQDTSSSSPFGITDIGDNSVPTFVDIDGDGDMDAFVGEFSGNINFFRNIGNSRSASFTKELGFSPFGLSYTASNCAPSFADIDGDGDFDAFVGVGNGEIFFFRNNGNSSSPSFVASNATAIGLVDVGSTTAPTFADIDSDGDLDAFIGDLEGAVFFFENKPCKSAHTINHAQLAQDLFITNESITSRAVIRNGREVIFSVGESMTLDTLFEVRDGATFYGLIDGCPL